jgi:hypothetical protein
MEGAAGTPADKGQERAVWLQAGCVYETGVRDCQDARKSSVGVLPAYCMLLSSTVNVAPVT